MQKRLKHLNSILTFLYIIKLYFFYFTTMLFIFWIITYGNSEYFFIFIFFFKLFNILFIFNLIYGNIHIFILFKFNYKSCIIFSSRMESKISISFTSLFFTFYSICISSWKIDLSLNAFSNSFINSLFGIFK